MWPFRRRRPRIVIVPAPPYALEAAAARETLDFYLARGEVSRISAVDVAGPGNSVAVLTVEVTYRGEPAS